MLPGRIELPTSPLPRECSTTELRQRTLCVSACSDQAESPDRNMRQIMILSRKWGPLSRIMLQAGGHMPQAARGRNPTA